MARKSAENLESMKVTPLPVYLSAPPRHSYRATCQAMGELLTAGGKVFWVAPSGGRDRPAPRPEGNEDPSLSAAEEFKVAPFDSKVLDMFRIVAMQSQKVFLLAIISPSFL
jgi:hypothetical protein